MTTKIFKMSCQEIENQFGKGNFDDATEYFYDLIYRCFGNSNQFNIKNIYFDAVI